MSTYLFSRKDIRQDPSLYMYAPFIGRPFLQAYTSNRTESMLVLREQYVEGQDVLGDTLMKIANGTYKRNNFESRGIIAEPGSTIHNTADTIKNCLYAVLEDGSLNKDNINSWIEILIRKIEIARRLWVSYGSGMNPVERQDAGAQTYAMFAALLSLNLNNGERIKRLNTLLKTNDLLICLQNQIVCGSLAIACTYLALSIESTAIADLTKEKVGS